MAVRSALLVTVLFQAISCLPETARAQPSPVDLAAAAAHRFPQPVRVGALLGLAVVRPTESQDLLGHVEAVVRRPNGSVLIVIRYGGLLGLGTRPIAVPVEAMTLVGQEMQVVGLSPAELSGLPRFDGADTAPVGPGEVIRVGLAKPAH